MSTHLLGGKLHTDSFDAIAKSLENVSGEVKKLKQKNTAQTKKDIAASVTDDLLVIQSIKSVDELKRVENILSKRLREWSALFYPGKQDMIEVAQALKEKTIVDFTSMGAELSVEHAQALTQLATDLIIVHTAQDKQLKYIEQQLKAIAPTVLVLTEPRIAAHLLEQAGGLKKLMELPASTIQVLGAEKALFRHLKTGARPPKYGILFNHELVQQMEHDKQGKAARLLADKIALAAKIDYFKGKNEGKKMLAEIKKKLGL